MIHDVLTDLYDNRPNLALYATKASPAFTGTVTGITKAMVGLGNVDNTADSAKTFTAAQLATGTVAPARLATGTANANTYLAGDGTWKTPPAASLAYNPTPTQIAAMPTGTIYVTGP